MTEQNNIISFPAAKPTIDTLDCYLKEMRDHLLENQADLNQSCVDAAIHSYRNRVEPIIKGFQNQTALKINRDDPISDEQEVFAAEIQDILNRLLGEIFELEMLCEFHRRNITNIVVSGI